MGSIKTTINKDSVTLLNSHVRQYALTGQLMSNDIKQNDFQSDWIGTGQIGTFEEGYDMP